MPTTRRSAGSVRGRTGPTKGQSTISFSNKVTKSVTNDTKKAVVAPAVAKVESAEEPSHAKVDEVEDDVVAEPEDEPEPEVQPEEIEQEPEKTEAELEAEKITDAHITKYWKGIEKERIAPRVHQRDLDVSEKVLRYFDVSSQYGVGYTVLRSSSEPAEYQC